LPKRPFSGKTFFLMCLRILGLCLLAAVLACAGCKKSSTPEAEGKKAIQLPAPIPETLARVHWIGKKRIAADTNSAHLMTIWNLPESARLENQTLDKLALAHQLYTITNKIPWTNNYSSLVASDPVAAKLRPLLEDLLNEESYFEVRQLPNQPGEFGLAIKIPAARAGVWETNLSGALESLLGSRFGVAGIDTNTPGRAMGVGHEGTSKLVSIGRAGDWTLFGMGPGTNTALTDMAQAISVTGMPYGQHPPNWLQADFDPLKVSAALKLGWKLPAMFPAVGIAVTGDGANVRTRGQLKFPQPLPFETQPWNIPTNLIHDPLISFTAGQGLGTFLNWLPAWTRFSGGADPAQFFAWSHHGIPFLTFFAAPLTNAAVVLDNVAQRLLTDGNQWVTNSVGKFERTNNNSRVIWNGLSIIAPFLDHVQTPGGDFLSAGVAPLIDATNPPPPELLAQIQDKTNLVYYDWEFTGPRAHAWIDIGQLARLLLNRPQIPFESASLAWFKAAEGLLGNAVTGVTKPNSQQFNVSRSSSCGFSSLELQILSDWLETLTAEVPPSQRPSTNGHPARLNRANGE
jgi:hypothetical protein